MGGPPPRPPQAPPVSAPRRVLAVRPCVTGLCLVLIPSPRLQTNANQRDLNVKEAWEQGVTGRGVVVSHSACRDPGQTSLTSPPSLQPTIGSCGRQAAALNK